MIGEWLITIACACLCAAGLTWFLSRRVGEDLADPLLFERVAVLRRRAGLASFVVFVAAGIVLVTGSWRRFDIGAFLVVLLLCALACQLGVVLGGRSLRLRLKPESPELAVEVVEWARVVVAFTAFIYLVLLTPFALMAVPSAWQWPAALVWLVVLLVWHARLGSWMCWWLAASPVEDVELLERFEAVQARSAAPVARIRWFGQPHGLVNAYAAPGRSPFVLFTRACLDSLDRHELCAIFGHELAHLEDHAFRRFRRELPTVLLIVLGCLLVPVGSLDEVRVAGVWLVAVGLFILLRASSMRETESKCDRRAIELSGDVEALIRGLTRLYEKGFVPRRRAIETEMNATHPSLAQRIADLRAAAVELGLATRSEPDSDREPLVIRGQRDRLEPVVLDDERITWLRISPEQEVVNGDQLLAVGEPVRSVAYSELVDLRVVLMRRGPVLRIVEALGPRHELDLAADEVAGTQDWLDHVDVRLASRAERLKDGRFGNRLLAVLSLLALCTASLGHSLGFGEMLVLLLLCLLVVFFRTRPWLGALGAAAVVAVCQAIADRFSLVSHELAGGLALVGLLAVGAVMLVRARASRRFRHLDGRPGRTAWMLLIAGVVIMAVQLTALSSTDIGIGIHLWARNAQAAGLLIVASAGALLWSRRFGHRRYLALVALFVLLKAGLATELVARRFYFDPLREPLPEVTLVTRSVPVVASETVDEYAWKPRLSPDGAHFLLMANRDGGGVRIIVAGFDGSRGELHAQDAVFVDNRRVLSVDSDAAGVSLALEPIVGLSDPDWTLRLESIHDPYDLELWIDGDEWQLGVCLYSGDYETWTGRVGEDGATRAVIPRHGDTGYRTLTGTDSAIERSELRSTPADASRWERMFRSALFGWLSAVELRSADASGLAVLGVTSKRVSVLSGGLSHPGVLVVNDGSHSQAWLVERGRLNGGVGGLDGEPSRGAWDGERLVVPGDGHVAIVNVRGRRGILVPRRDSPQPFVTAIRGKHVALAIWTGHAVRIELLAEIASLSR